jgi:hypothetical protein
MTGAHSRVNQHPVRGAVMAAGMAASLLLLAGLFVTSLVLMATHSKYLQIVVIAFQSTIAVWFAGTLAVKMLRDRTPSPVVLADWIGDGALVIVWIAIALASVGQYQGWMHGAFEYTTTSLCVLFAVSMPVYWWRGKQWVVLALTARAIAGRWPWSAGT